MTRARPVTANVVFALALICAAFLAPAGAARAQGVLVLTVEGGIGPAVTEYIRSGIEEAQTRGSSLIVLRINTPGGLDSSTRDIIQAMLASPVPIAIYVAPPGARAASAGTYILYASHLAAMAPATNLGAATPVRIGGGGGQSPSPGGEPGEQKQPAGPDALERKIVNDSVAYIRGLAQLQNRNADWAEQAVREGVSLTYSAALERKVIEIVANNLDDMLAQADGRTVQLFGKPHTLQTKGAPVETFDPDFRLRLLAAITNPNIAYVLLLAGVYGLLFEILSPGAMVPGAVGAVSLLVGLYALNMLDVNVAGALLIVLGMAFMAAEALTPTFGVFAGAGVLAFLAGSLFLFRGDMPEFSLSPWVIGGATLVTAGVFLWAAAEGLREWRRPVRSGEGEYADAPAVVLEWSAGAGFVRFHGEIWRARGPEKLEAGAQARVVGRNGLMLEVVAAGDVMPAKGAHHDI